MAIGSIVLGISVITAISIQLQVKKAQHELAEQQVILQTSFSKASLVSDPFEALLTALQAAQKIKKLEPSATNETQMQVMRTLQQAIYHVREIDRAIGHRGAIRSVTFSPDGKTFASASEDGTVKLWNVTDGTLLQNLPTHRRAVWSAIFNPDGKTLATISSDSTVKLWNLEDINDNRIEPQLLKGHRGRIESIGFSPDGKTLVSGSFDSYLLDHSAVETATTQTKSASAD